jgi:CHAD domain-containing protein
VKETLERELKLSVEPGFELPPLPVETTPKRLRAIYYDTSDLRLARHGVTLRRRSEEGRDRWQLKLPTHEARLELEWEADDSAIPGEITWLLTAHLRGHELGPIAELHTLRRAVRLTAQGEPAADVVHDSVEVLEDNRVVRSFEEVEIEQIGDGAERLIARVEKQLRAAGARSSDGRAKVFQALDLPAPGAPQVPREAPAIEHLRAYLQHQVAALVASDPPTRRSGREGVHRMRVASRRMRSVLKEANRLLDPSWVQQTRDELKWLGGVLGEVRDPDVFSAYVESEVRSLSEAAAGGGTDLVTLIHSQSEASRRRLAEALDSPRYLALLDRLEAVAESLPVTPEHESLRKILRRAARRTRGKLRRASAKSSGDVELHELRIAAKRARYAGELAETVVGSAARRLAKRAAAVQKILGEHQDAVVAEERLEGLVRDATPAGAFVAGRLAGRQRDRRADARAKLPKVANRLERAARKL